MLRVRVCLCPSLDGGRDVGRGGLELCSDRGVERQWAGSVSQERRLVSRIQGKLGVGTTSRSVVSGTQAEGGDSL